MKYEVRRSRSKLLYFAILSFSMALLCYWVLSQASPDDNDFVFYKYKIVGIVCLMFFTPGGIFLLYKWWDDTPYLVMDSEGISENSYALRGIEILWKDIVEIGEGEIKKTRFILVYLRNPEVFISRYEGYRKTLFIFNNKLYGTPILLATNTLEISQDELVKIMRNKLTQFIA